MLPSGNRLHAMALTTYDTVEFHLEEGLVQSCARFGWEALGEAAFCSPASSSRAFETGLDVLEPLLGKKESKSQQSESITNDMSATQVLVTTYDCSATGLNVLSIDL